jgi:phage tail sheath protein FI
LSLDPTKKTTVLSEEFNFEISQGSPSNVYSNLSIDSAHPRYFVNIINAANDLVRVELVEPPPPVQPPNNLPANASVDLTGGANEDLTTLGDGDYIDALETLREIDDVNLIAIPDGAGRPVVQQDLIVHCEQMQDRFAVLDALPPAPGQLLFGERSVEEQRRGLDSTRGYAALYYPWLQIPRVGPGAPILAPPSGHVCGIMARSDNTRGVHKAPANEIVNGALGIERNMSDIDQGQLNLQGINVVRLFQTGGRPVLWGARTTATDRNWQYVNVRRLFLFIEESIEEGIRWAVFEPNNLQLWQKLKRTITDFLTRVWRDGALFGAKAEEAFYVRIDETLNPFSEQQLGRLHIEIGLRPTYPAEFIIVRIGIWSGGAEVTEA